jgi:hypothetical protein
MRVELLAQTDAGGLTRTRTGDVLNAAIADARHDRFKFAVAYMRVSGINRLSASLGTLVGRGGAISGAVGIDDGVTTVEALAALAALSGTSTVFHTVSGFIYHPKLYLLAGAAHAVIVVGSPNLTRDGLYRNIEAGTAIKLDLALPDDLRTLQQFEAFVDAFLSLTNPNVVQITTASIASLEAVGLIRREAQSRDPGPSAGAGGDGANAGAIGGMFPPIAVPTAPPAAAPAAPPLGPAGGGAGAAPVPAPVPATSMFLMEMSSFDTSQGRTSGTPEILIPVAAVGFFPAIAFRGRQYEDVFFDVLVNTPTGVSIRNYRFWSYTTKDEYRLRPDTDGTTLSQIQPGGGAVLVITRLPAGSNPEFEVTIVNPGYPQHAAMLALCNQSAQGKRWGIY